MTVATPPSPFELFGPQQLLAVGIALLLFGMVVLVADVLVARLDVPHRSATVLALAIFAMGYQGVQTTPGLIDGYALVGLALAAGLPVVTVVSLVRGLFTT